MPPSRRALLRTLATTGALALAGCTGETRHGDAIPHDHGDPVTDPEVRFVRDPDGGHLFATDTADRTDRSTDAERTDASDRIGTVEFLAAPEDRERVTFRETPAGTELRAFVDATDLGSAAVYLLERSIGACYTLALLEVVRDGGGGVSADFCRELRPADVACSADRHATVGVAIRVPFDGDAVDGLGTGMSSRCAPRPVIAREGGERQ